MGFDNKDFNEAKANGPANTVLLYEDFVGSLQKTQGGNVLSGIAGNLAQGIDGHWGCCPFSGSAIDNGDAYSWIKMQGSLGPGLLGGCPAATSPWVSSPTMHDPGSNFLALDGHVKFLRPEKVSPGWNASNLNNPGTCATGSANFWNAGGSPAAGTGSMLQGSNPVTLTFSAT
jgi:prepilin-type processing-associated H-X9-DG protein